MSGSQEKILYICTCGEDRAETAHMPFVLANAALAMDIQATIVLNGDGVTIGKRGNAEDMPKGGGFPPMKALLTTFMELGGKLWVCGPCIKTRGIDEAELVDGASITAAGAVNVEALEADAVLVF